ncbi:sigma-70 family RNA polymerase sigma factor [Povalibacter sp.]|uniref:sigma-70 family RNA polymerase sigma factor n=1 Tax=Povalibacter sp. TaxID=1962978 RepID=UPI002F42BD25
MDTPAQSVTQLLQQWRNGNTAAIASLMSLLYRELRAMAREHVRRERRSHTLQGTALVNEAFMRLVKLRSVDIRDRAHFFAVASTVMRRILVDHARARLSRKRGGDAVRVAGESLERVLHSDGLEADLPAVDFDPAFVLLDADRSGDITALDDLLSRLQTFDARQSQVVEMRYFGGLTVEQTAQALDISEATVKREWVAARAWLRREFTRATQ